MAAASQTQIYKIRSKKRLGHLWAVSAIAFASFTVNHGLSTVENFQEASDDTTHHKQVRNVQAALGILGTGTLGVIALASGFGARRFYKKSAQHRRGRGGKGPYVYQDGDTIDYEKNGGT